MEQFTCKWTIGTANKEACNFLGKSIADVTGFTGGDVFECENARLPEGCGKTFHCSGCTIRNTVMDTVETGKANRKVKAYLNPQSLNESNRFELLISTEKIGGVVFLKVEEIQQLCSKKLG